jgi:site-specific DNA recombinase
MTERAAMYARVSTARQEQEKTIASQIEALEREAEAQGLPVPAERRYLDNGVSGTRLDRPALDALRDAAADGLLDVVLISSPDRLSRNYVHQQVVLEELNARGVRVHFLEHSPNERAEDRLLVQMQGVIAEYERAKILERTRRGRLHKVRTGQALPFSQAPYGYAIVRSAAAPHGVVVIEEVEAAHVRAMYQWVVEEGLSARQVAKRLNTRGVRPRRARRWIPGSVYRILTSSTYVGTATYAKHETIEPARPRRPGAYRKVVKSSRRTRPPERWFSIPVPALIDEAVQHEVRARLTENKRMSPRSTRHDYLLRTLVVCGECGLRMSCIAKWSTDKHRQYLYYTCNRRAPVDTGREERCRARPVRADELDALVWGALREWLQRPEILAIEVQAWRESHEGTVQSVHERARLETARTRLQGQIDRLIDAYQQGALEVQELKARRERLEAALHANRVRDDELHALHVNQARMDALAEKLSTFAATVRTGLDALDFSGRQRLVRLLLERIVIAGENLTIEHALPLSGRFGGLRLGEAARRSVGAERHGAPEPAQNDARRAGGDPVAEAWTCADRGAHPGAVAGRAGGCGAGCTGDCFAVYSRDEPGRASHAAGCSPGRWAASRRRRS